MPDAVIVTAKLLRRMYLRERKSTPDVALALGVNRSRARKLLLDAGIKLRSAAEGTRLAAWKISRVHLGKKKKPFTKEHRSKIRAARLAHAAQHAAGVCQRPRGHLEITRGPNKGRLLHTVLVEQKIGRRITKNEVVHHRDHDPSNNRLSNLELMTRSAHTSLHRRIVRCPQ